MRKRIGMILGILMLAIAVLTGCGQTNTASKTTSSSSSSSAAATTAQAGKEVTIKMLNVGQGDSILIRTPEQTVLIDTSDVDERDKLKRELDKAGVKKIDKVILTHPHADHIGGMDVLLKDYQVGAVYDNGMPSTSKLYLSYRKALKAKNISYQALKAGDVLDFGGGVSFKVFYPTSELQQKGAQKGNKHDPNNESVVGRLTYGSFSMLFTGDAETPVEEEILKTYAGELKSTILKAPHHGSSTSSSVAYLKAVWPEAVLISCGQGNDYGHPHTDVLARFLGQQNYTDRRDGKQKKTKLVKDDKGKVLKAKVYETDKNGTITVTTDGKGYKLQAEEGEAQ